MTQPMINQLEHANIRVRSIDRTIEFLTTALPGFRVRGGGGDGDHRWVHLGSDYSYVALSQDDRRERGKGPGLNHLGFVIDDWEGVSGRLEAAGYKKGSLPDDHPHHKRIYYLDGDGLEWEFVQYFSDDPAERNDYSY